MGEWMAERWRYRVYALHSWIECKSENLPGWIWSACSPFAYPAPFKENFNENKIQIINVFIWKSLATQLYTRWDSAGPTERVCVDLIWCEAALRSVLSCAVSSTAIAEDFKLSLTLFWFASPSSSSSSTWFFCSPPPQPQLRPTVSSLYPSYCVIQYMCSKQICIL